MDCSRKLLAKKSLESAEFHAGQKRLELAVPQFLTAFMLDPSCQEERGVWEIFLGTLTSWADALEQNKFYDELVNGYNQAMEVFPENEELLNNLGLHAFRLNHTNDACQFFSRALASRPDYLPAKRNLQNARNSLVDRWHFRMLNDKTRNEAYRKAILKRVGQGFHKVLDIGTGSGILSLFASEAGAKSIYACDSCPTMIGIAEKVLSENNVTDVTLLSCPSYEIVIPEVMPERVSLVVTETFDSGIFGENILQTLLHAWEHLLGPPHPALADPKAPIQNDRFEFSAVIPHRVTLFIAAIECSEIYRKNSHVQSALSTPISVRLPRLVTDKTIEPYDTEQLNCIPGGFTYLTAAHKVLSVNLNSIDDIRRHLAPDHVEIISLPCTKQGRFDAVVAWFQLDLDDENMISNGPEELSCWDQAVFAFESINLRCNNTLDLLVSSANGKLTITYQNEPDIYKILASEEAIRFANDEIYTHSLTRMTEFCGEQSILDFSPIPFLGVNIIKCHGGLLTCFVDSAESYSALTKIMKYNGVESKVIYTSSIQDNKKFDVIVSNLIDNSGELKEDAINRLPVLRLLLKPGGVLVPKTLSVCCQLVFSDWLAEMASVLNDDRTSGFRIGQHINNYQSFFQLDFNLDSIHHKPFSEEIPILELEMDGIQTDAFCTRLVTVVNSGKINAIPYWFNTRWVDESQLPVCSKRADSACNQSAVLVTPPLEVMAGESLQNLGGKISITSRLLPTMLPLLTLGFQRGKIVDCPARSFSKEKHRYHY